MQFDLLAHRHDAIPVLGRWYNQEWGQLLRNESEAETIEYVKGYLSEDKIPFIVVATEAAGILGAAQLKYREMEDLFPEKKHWVGGVFVAPAYRGRGLGCKLVQEIADRAPSYGVATLHLQTERLDGGLYRSLGWRPIQQVRHHGLEVLVMERQVGA
jgi:GNAT superfamily N-acetyltransferase